MVKVLNVEKLIETQSQKHRERLLSQFSRLLDSKPSFVTYYSIDGVNSSAEMGTRDIMKYVGEDSPVRFKKVLNMPMYSLNVVTAEIMYDETKGTYTQYEDEGLILNSVIRPLPGDHFVIEDFNKDVIFAISDVRMRAIRGQDHYVVQYTLVTSSRRLHIDEQVAETYKTIFRNIGTEDKVLIKQEDYDVLRDYMEHYRNIHQRYLDEFYDPSLGYLKTPEWLDDKTSHGTCKYLIRFFMDNRIIYFDEILESIFAFEMVLPFQSQHNKRYMRSFPLHSFIKRRVKPGSLYIKYNGLPISLFKEVSEESIEQSVEFIHVPEGEEYVPGYKEILLYDETFPQMIASKEYENASPIEKIIAKFVNDEDIDLDEFDDVMDDYEVSDIFRMYFIPLILVILQVRIKSLQTLGNN